MAVRGDFKKLGELIRSMKRLKASGMKRVTQQVGNEALALVLECFVLETSPFGEKWKQSQRARRDGGKTLQDTRRLHNSINLRVTGKDSFRIATNVKYARIHNEGGDIKRKERLQRRSKRGLFSRRGRYSSWLGATQVTMPKRQFMPIKGVIPRAWMKRLHAVAALTLVRVMK